MNYQGKVCVVTGVASGLGKRICEYLVNMNAKVYGIDKENLNNTNFTYIKADISKIEEIDNAFLEIPTKIDSFFAVAGLSGFKNDYETTFNTNFTANKYITEKYLRWRMDDGSSILYVTSIFSESWLKYKNEQEKIVNASNIDDIYQIINKIKIFSPSILAYPYASRCLSHYAAIKAIEYGKLGIRINNIMPSVFDSNMKDELIALYQGEANLLEEAGVAFRIATIDEIAKPCLFINSNLASYIAGEELHIDYSNLQLINLGYKKDISDFSLTNRFKVAKITKILKEKGLLNNEEK